MSEIITVGLDLAKNVFQAHGADASPVSRQSGSTRRRSASTSSIQPRVIIAVTAFLATAPCRPSGSGMARLPEVSLRG